MKLKAIFIVLLLAISATASGQIREIAKLSPEEGLFKAILYYDIHHPYIVFAQAVLETGHFTSRLCVEENNLFGIYDSRTKKYKEYDSWVFSVIDYKYLVQNKYKGGDYYEFLDSIGYASDTLYTQKVRRIANEYMKYD